MAGVITAAALREFRPLAEQGHSGAQTGPGFIYVNGAGGPQDDAKAMKWWHKAADQGDTLAQTALSSMYDLGRGVLHARRSRGREVVAQG